MYFENVDSSHKNWEKISTKKSRIGNIENSEEFHKYWLDCVLAMNDRNLEKNTLGLTGTEVKEMAKQILEILSV